MMAKSTSKDPSRIVDIDVADEMRESFLEYAYSVIYARALPDARDGLKPVQRRILFQMAQMGLRPERGHVKSARVVGEVMGRLHPHGDSAIYDALVRMAQTFSLRLPFIDGHGNFGSLDDGPAAMRYTEAKLALSAIKMTAEIDEDVVDFLPNYDGREQEPAVLPAAIPSLLVNGASGIAVGMATNLAPHNLAEVINAIRHVIKNPDASTDDIMTFIPGPDFPTGGVIIGLDGVREAYQTGKGSFRIRARTRIEQITSRKRGIVVTELPLSVGPERVIEKVKELVTAKKLEGISDIVDYTDGETGLNLVIECKSTFAPESVLEKLFRLTPLEESFTINAVALVDGQPKTLGVKELIDVFINHRIEVVTRRSHHRLKVAMDRLHLVKGLLTAIVDIDEVIEVIRDSDDAAAARGRLISIFDLSEVQANYILEMPLRRLTKFSRIELEKESDSLTTTCAELNEILGDENRRRDIVSTELAAISAAHSTPRRTLLLEASTANQQQNTPLMEIPDEPCTVLLSSTGLLARTSAIRNIFNESHIEATTDRTAHDVIISHISATTRGEIGVVTSLGVIHRLNVVDIPAIPATSGVPGLSAGAPISAFLDFGAKEEPIALTNIGGEIVMGTRNGVIKRLSAGQNTNRDFWDVIRLEEGDYLVGAAQIPLRENPNQHAVFVTAEAQLLHFPISTIKAQGRSAGGIVGVKSSSPILFFGVVDFAGNNDVVTIAGSSAALPGTEVGTAKVSALEIFPSKGRATGGVRCQKFRSGEDSLILAWVGPAPARAATASGTTAPLPPRDNRRDSTGVALVVPVDAIGGELT